MRSRVLIVVGVLAAALVCGGWFLEAGFHGAGPGALGPAWIFGRAGTGGRVFAQVLEHVGRDYVDSLPTGQIYQKAIDGMLLELHDPHSVFLPADRLHRLTESTTGSYVGLGVQIDIRDGWITVIAPLAGSPAQRSGIQSGDRIVAVDGQSTHGWTQEEATAALHGAVGTTVQLSIERTGLEHQMAFVLTRSEIHVRSVRHAEMLQAGVGYVETLVFSDSTARELRQAIDSLRAQGMHTLVLDLRNDPGGLLNQGVAVADLFLRRGDAVVSMRGRSTGSTHRFSSDADEPWPDLGLIVLVNRGTASASEIVAGALQDHDRALIVGMPSYGKGSAQTLFHLDDAALKLTTALWYTPSGRSISRHRPATGDDDAAGGGGGGGGGDEDVGRPNAGDATASAMTYHTDAGRPVYGGGGIAPDVLVSDSALATADAALQQALGTQVPLFRDALTADALARKAREPLSSLEAPITPAMREELWQRMRARGVKLDRSTFDRMTPTVDRWLRNELVRYQFGTEAAFRSMLRTDATVLEALELAAHAHTARDLVLHPTPLPDARGAVTHRDDPSGDRPPIR